MVKGKPKKLYRKNMVRNVFQIGHEVVLYKYHWKGFLCKCKSRKSGPFIVNQVFIGGAVELSDPKYACTFVVKGEKLRSYGESENTSEKVCLMLVEP